MNVTVGSVTIPLPPVGQIIFLMSGGLAVLASLMMVTRKDAVHSALWLVVTFFQLAVMYVMLGAEFLAALQVLVYTGAILVLFLFVIMLLGLREAPKLGGIHTAQMIAAWPLGLLLALELTTVILFNNQPPQAHKGDLVGGVNQVWSTTRVAEVGGNVQALGQTLYTQFLLPFEVASLILLLAVLGAIVLARKEEPAEVEEILPSIGISLGRRSVSNSPQEEQIEKKLLPALGIRSAPDMRSNDYEMPTMEQPSGFGAGTTSGADVDKSGASGSRKV
ncbi:MAG: NADH-quinone oxidoreductase subunit J [Chloroflexota bacterium]|nr:NADH-quinone oxidoreductase subunit J [Chloroflexota bacterium]